VKRTAFDVGQLKKATGIAIHANVIKVSRKISLRRSPWQCVGKSIAARVTIVTLTRRDRRTDNASELPNDARLNRSGV
jgi:hypothetical protein